MSSTGLLEVAADADDRNFTVTYDYEGWHGTIRACYPEPIGDLRAMVAAMGLSVATYLGQLCLAPRIRLAFPVSSAMVDAMAPLAAMLYDVRRWKDGLPLTAPPEVEFDEVPDPVVRARPLDQRRTLLLWSGGKDSTLSALLLRANGYRVDALHLGVNQGVEALEAGAVLDLAGALDLDPIRVSYEHDDFLAFSTAHTTAGAWNDYPLANVVPFGRDLLTTTLALPVAAARGASFISLGHDHECRNSYFDYDGRSVPRNDVESTRGALALAAYARDFAVAGLGLLPPVAGLPELRILHEMLVAHPDLMSRTAFCFWGRNCGRCAKCLRYYLAARLFEVDVLTFAVNPLSVGACPELDDILRPDALGVLFQRQVLYCLGRLAERGDIRREEERLAQFARLRLPEVQPLLDSWATELLSVGTDPQLPTDFRYDLAPVTRGIGDIRLIP